MKLGEKNQAKIIGKFIDNPVRLAVFQQVQPQGKYNFILLKQHQILASATEKQTVA